jgi:Ran GTPase-activating protein (RanGAP) involved in mRNA processing and transport
LSELNLSGNELSILTANAFNGARNLQKLDLSRNWISSINPLAFVGLHSLVELNLSYNKLHNESFSSSGGIDWAIESLKTLDLSHNRIFYFQVMPYQSFSGIRNLEQLFLQHNNITIDYGAFASNKRLRILDLSYNAFPYFELDFLLSIRSLEKLFLSGNGISYASQLELNDISSAFPKLKSVAISNNSFACEVLASMIRKLDKAKIELVVNDDEFVSDARNLRGIKCL